jgi:pantetheine-phosphate adenylyltransferase
MTKPQRDAEAAQAFSSSRESFVFRLPRRSLAKADYSCFVIPGAFCSILLHFQFPLRAFSVMRRAIYPGSFDPVTNGHLDVIERARKLFDEVIVAVAINDQKHPLFAPDERLAMLRQAITVDAVRVAPMEGLLVEFAASEGAHAVVRGLRAISDFEFEFQMALMNRKLDPEIETIFLMPKEEYTYLSSRIVKEIAKLGGDVSAFVPPLVAKALAKKFKSPVESVAPVT